MHVLLLKLAFAAAASCTASVLAYAFASASSRPAERLGVRGLKRRRAIEAGGLFPAIEPAARWIATRLSGLLPERLYQNLDRHVVLAGDYLGLTPEEYAALTLIGGGGGLVAGYVYSAAGGTPVAILFLTLLGSMLTYGAVDSEMQKRDSELARGLPYAIDLLALALSAGLDFPGGLRQVIERTSDTRNTMTEEFERVLQELSLGRTRREALEGWGTRTRVIVVHEFIAAVLQAEQRGSPLAETLTIQAQVSRQRRSARAEEGAARSAVLVTVPLALLFVCIMALLIGPLLFKMQGMLSSKGLG